MKILLSLLMLVSSLATALPVFANEVSNESELNGEVYNNEEIGQLADIEFNFEDFTLEELMEVISDELLETLYNFDVIIEEESDLEQLLDLDDEIWEYFENHENQDLHDELTALIEVLEDLLDVEVPENDEYPIVDDNDTTDYLEVDEDGYATSETEETDIAINPRATEITPTNVEIAPTTANTAAVSHIRRTGVVISRGQLRRSANSSANVITNLSTNTNVTINRRRGSWYEITVGNRTGWVERNRIARTSSFGVVTGNNVAVRHSRRNNSRVLTRASRGTRIRITRRTGSWSQVRVNNRTGWIRNSQINITRGRPGRVNRRTDIRILPNASANITRRIPNNTQVVQLQRTTNGWTQVELRHANGTLRGWVQTSHVRNQNHARRVTGNNIALRNRPNGNGNVIRRLSRNTRVTVRATTANWSHVSVGRHRGWVRNSQLSRLNLPRVIHNWQWVQTQPARPAVPGRPAQPAVDPVWGPAPGRWVINVNCGIHDGVDRGVNIFDTLQESQEFTGNPDNGVCYIGNNPNVSRNTAWIQPDGTVTHHYRPDIIITPGRPAAPAVPAIPARAAQGRWRCTITGHTTRTGTRAATDPR